MGLQSLLSNEPMTRGELLKSAADLLKAIITGSTLNQVYPGTKIPELFPPQLSEKDIENASPELKGRTALDVVRNGKTDKKEYIELAVDAIFQEKNYKNFNEIDIASKSNVIERLYEVAGSIKSEESRNHFYKHASLRTFELYDRLSSREKAVYMERRYYLPKHSFNMADIGKDRSMMIRIIMRMAEDIRFFSEYRICLQAGDFAQKTGMSSERNLFYNCALEDAESYINSPAIPFNEKKEWYRKAGKVAGLLRNYEKADRYMKLSRH